MPVSFKHGFYLLRKTLVQVDFIHMVTGFMHNVYNKFLLLNWEGFQLIQCGIAERRVLCSISSLKCPANTCFGTPVSGIPGHQDIPRFTEASAKQNTTFNHIRCRAVICRGIYSFLKMWEILESSSLQWRTNPWLWMRSFVRNIQEWSMFTPLFYSSSGRGKATGNFFWGNRMTFKFFSFSFYQTDDWEGDHTEP